MITLPDETPDTVKTYDEQRLKKISARCKKWNNISLVFFGCAVVWLLLLKYADMGTMIGPLGSLYLLTFTMILAVISVILSAYFTWRARTLRKEIEYYSADPEPEEESENADL